MSHDPIPPSSPPLPTSTSVDEDETTSKILSPKTDDDGDNDKEEERVDDEGLSIEPYDVVLCGTGLVQSILASALSRAGKTVLHCDGNGWYGELDSSWTLDGLLDWTSENVRSEGLKEAASDSDGDGGGAAGVAADGCGGGAITLDPRGGCADVRVHSVGNGSVGSRWPLRVGTEVLTPCGPGAVVSLPDETGCGGGVSSLAVEMRKWTMADGKHPVAYFGYQRDDNTSDDEDDVTSYFAVRHKLIPTFARKAQTLLLTESRSFGLDLTPGTLYASGSASRGLVDSGVADYLEFKSLIGLHLLMAPDAKSSRGGSRRSGGGSGAGFGKGYRERGLELELLRVPCSKGDVFSTKLLSPVDKRRLMKFLQLSMDYAAATTTDEASTLAAASSTPERNISGEGGTAENTSKETASALASQSTGPRLDVRAETVLSLNERQLNQGRSLSRPQNKTISRNDMETLLESIRSEMPFEEYLTSVHKLNDRLVTIVMHALALSSIGGNKDDNKRRYSTGQGMKDLANHLTSLGRFGGTAFLVPMYGAGELSQSFCRSSAVHGGTYLLRRPPKRIVLDREGGGGNNAEDTATPMAVSGVVLGADVQDDDDRHSGKSSGLSTGSKEKLVKCLNIVVSSDAILEQRHFVPTVATDIVSSKAKKQDTRTKRKILRRISILDGVLIHDEEGNDDNDSTGREQRHIIVIPPNAGPVRNQCAVHGVVLDSSVQVAPNGCTVLHLTTTVECDKDDKKKEADAGILERAFQCLATTSAAEKRGGEPIEELYYVSFSYDDHSNDTKEELSLNEKGVMSMTAKGLHVCYRRSQTVAVDAAFEEARRIFRDVCGPDAVFLKRSKEMNDTVRERLGDQGDNSDDEGMVLESAMSMIGTTGAEAATGASSTSAAVDDCGDSGGGSNPADP